MTAMRVLTCVAALPTPEEILGYIYAVLYAPTYRARYAEFLRIDFPRVPFPESAEDFETLSGVGWALVQAHLLRELPRRKLADYQGKGDNTARRPLPPTVPTPVRCARDCTKFLPRRGRRKRPHGSRHVFRSQMTLWLPEDEGAQLRFEFRN